MYPEFERRRCEDVLYEKLIQHVSDTGFVGAMNVLPVISGIAAVNDRAYDSGYWWITGAAGYS